MSESFIIWDMIYISFLVWFIASTYRYFRELNSNSFYNKFYANITPPLFHKKAHFPSRR